MELGIRTAIIFLWERVRTPMLLQADQIKLVLFYKRLDLSQKNYNTKEKCSLHYNSTIREKKRREN
ncbi:hypothetical protein BpHYR1_029480 [Brachionus plicatilis]|uniref:Uncharacterized protein n=1 Tax=Brachionus plicatilis TaxID=10195 RepID=A0A3M7S246_BRAPC|nr:hypothetical protein BpHYR1_029480 [Brachionus plicatilis]